MICIQKYSSIGMCMELHNTQQIQKKKKKNAKNSNSVPRSLLILSIIPGTLKCKQEKCEDSEF